MTTVAVATTEIDSATAPALADQLHRCEPGDDVLVDFADVRFCDSTGIRVLLAALKQQMAGGGSLRLINVAPSVARVFEMTGLRNLVDHEPRPDADPTAGPADPTAGPTAG